MVVVGVHGLTGECEIVDLCECVKKKCDSLAVYLVFCFVPCCKRMGLGLYTRAPLLLLLPSLPLLPHSLPSSHVHVSSSLD